MYNFLRDSKVFIVRNGLRYELDIYPDLNFSQTFSETSVPVKTLHSQYNMFADAVINRKHPANFSFTVPLLYENDLSVLIELLTDYDMSETEATLKTADLYVVSNNQLYKLEKCVLENGVFQLPREGIVTLSLSGTATQLSNYVGSLPGIPQMRSPARTYMQTTALDVRLNSVPMPSVSSISIELSNDVSWVDYETIHKSQKVSVASESMTPEVFVVSGRTLSGNIQQYVTEDTTQFTNTWEIGSSLQVKVGTLAAQWGLEFDIPSIVFTNRLAVQELFSQSYDFRMNTSPNNLSQIIRYLP